MSNPLNALTSLLHRLGVVGPARVRAYKGTSAISYNTSTCRPAFLVALAIALCALAYTAVPALAATPTVLSESTSPTAKPSAELSLDAQVNAGEEAAGITTECHFQYGTASVSEHTVACEQGTPPGTLEGGEQGVAVTVTGLKAGTTYIYRVVLKNASGKIEGGEEKVTTLPVPATEVPSPVGSTTATFKGKLAPLNSTVPAEYFFVYNVGEEIVCTGERRTEPTASAGIGSGTKAVTTAVTELEPHQKYTVCLVSTNTLGDTEEDLTPKYFETKPAPPKIESETTPSVAAHEATLEAQINPNNQETTCSFEYATSEAALGTASATKLPAVPAPALGASFGPQAVSVSTGAVLKQVTTYYYRVIATNGAGTTTDPTIEHFKTLLEAPTTTAPTGVTAAAATLHGVVSPNEPGEAGTYEFRYRASGTACQGENEQVAVPATPGATVTGVQGQVVAAELPVAEPGEQYTYCLLVNGTAGTAVGNPVTFRALSIPPKVTTEGAGVEHATEVATTSAVLGAEINPGGGATTYHFEYDTSPYTSSAPHGQSTPESASIGSDDAEHVASTLVEGLQPGTTYHYRVVVSNASAPEPNGVDGPDATFTTQAAGTEFTLPDERAWELVSPPEKFGARIEAITFEGAIIQAAENGDAMTYVADAPVSADPEGNPSLAYSQVMSVREPNGGWTTRDLATPHAEIDAIHPGKLGEYYAFSPNLETGFVEPKAGAPQLAPEPSEDNMYLRENLLEPSATPEYQALTTNNNVYPPDIPYAGSKEQYYASSKNLQHVAFGSGTPLTPGRTGEGLYEWSRSSSGTPGTLHPINILPHGEVAAGATIGVTNSVTRNAVSDEGDVFWQWQEGGIMHLYMRDTATETTVQIDAPQDGVIPEAGSGARFQDASVDGELVYFTDDQRLVPGATAEYGSPELYVYNTRSGALQDLTADPGSGTSSDVRGVMLGAAESGEYVYFAADASLTKAPVECTIEGGVCLYVAHVQGAASTVALVAVLSGEDSHDWEGGDPYDPNLGLVTSRVSPDGEFATFMSARRLTGYDNIDASGGVPDEEVFEYSASTGRVTCVSCNPTQSRPSGVYDTVETGEASEGLGLLVDRSEAWVERWLAASVPGYTTWHVEVAEYQSRYLDDSGRVFFDGADALVPQDTNGKEDVYEYEPEGVGTCTEGTSSGSDVFVPQEAGCVALISSGKSSRESAFLDASKDGDDVFFLTAANLSSKDTDTSDDVYDAHVCTGQSPCANVASVVPPPCTTADSCKAAPVAQPAVFGAPASSTFSGSGNVASVVVAPKKAMKKTVKCVRPKKLVHGKCIKKARKRAKRARKSNRGARS